MQNVGHTTQNASHTMQNASQTALNVSHTTRIVGYNTLNVRQGPKGDLRHGYRDRMWSPINLRESVRLLIGTTHQF